MPPGEEIRRLADSNPDKREELLRVAAECDVLTERIRVAQLRMSRPAFAIPLTRVPWWRRAWRGLTGGART